MILRQSTSQVIRFGPCLDKTDGVTEETGLTLAQADMRLSKDGGAFAQKSAAGNATHDSDGWYSTTLSTTDTNTVGELKMNVHQPANMLPVWERWYVVEEAVYDALYAASAAGPLQSTTAGRTLDVSTGGEAGLDWANIGSPTTAQALSGTDIQLVATATDLTNLPTIPSNWLTAAGIAASALDGKGDWNIGKTGYTLTQSFPSNFAALGISVGGAVDDVVLCATTTTNTDMRGTDSANTVAPDNAGISANGVAIAALKDFDPAVDIVARVTLCDTVTENTDSAAIKKNAAFSNFQFLMVLTSDHVTPATGLTVTGQRSIDGGAYANVAGTIAEISNGTYQFDALAADTNGDVITWKFSSATADDTFITFKTAT